MSCPSGAAAVGDGRGKDDGARAHHFCVSVIRTLDIQCGKPSATIHSILACPAAEVFSVNRLCMFFTEPFTDTDAESLSCLVAYVDETFRGLSCHWFSAGR